HPLAPPLKPLSLHDALPIYLEKRLGVVLITRSPRPPTPTAKGWAYYEGCKELVERYMELEASVRNSPPDLPVTVQVAAIYSVGLDRKSTRLNSSHRTISYAV